jgi:transposase
MNPISYPKELRGRWYLAVDKYGKSVKETCFLFGISRQTYYKWYAIDHNRCSPDYHPEKQQPNTKLTSGVKLIIEQEKIKINYGPLKMKLLLKRRLGLEVSTTIIYRFYRRKGLIRRPQKKLPWYEPLKKKVIPAQAGRRPKKIPAHFRGCFYGFSACRGC